MMRPNPAAIRALRERTGMTQVQLAEAAGMHPSHLHRMETGERKGTPAQLVAIAEALKVPITVVAVFDEVTA